MKRWSLSSRPEGTRQAFTKHISVFSSMPLILLQALPLNLTDKKLRFFAAGILEAAGRQDPTRFRTGTNDNRLPDLD